MDPNSNVYDTEIYYNRKFQEQGDLGDFSKFYIIITIVTLIAAIIFILNIVLGCCSSHSEYWNDRHTGNRWIISLWTSTPHNQSALDYTEIDQDHLPQVVIRNPQEQTYEYSNVEFQSQSIEQVAPHQKDHSQYFEMQKRESDI